MLFSHVSVALVFFNFANRKYNLWNFEHDEMMRRISSGGSISQYNNMSYLPLPLYTTCRLPQPGYVHFPCSMKEMEVSTVFFSAHKRATPLHQQSISGLQDIITARIRRLTEGR